MPWRSLGPEIPDVQEVRARIVRSTLLVIAITGGLSGLLLLITSPVARQRQVFLACTTSLLALGIRALAGRVGFRLAAWGFVGAIMLLFAMAAWTAGGLVAPAIHVFMVLVILASLLLGPRGGLLTAMLAIACALVIALAQSRGALPEPWIAHTVWSRWWVLSVYIALVAVFQAVATRTIEGSLAYASRELQTRKRAEADLQAARDDLERQVAARTEELAHTVAVLEAQAVELNAARDAQSRFLALVSHELRTPLTSVRASLGLLAHRGDLPPEARALAEIADRNSVRLLNLTNELLDLEKAASGRFEVHPTLLDLRDPVRSAFEGLRSLAQVRSRAFELILPPDPVPVSGDGPRLEQVCMNLISNALRHARGEGEVSVRVAWRGPEAWVGVTNPGDPIPEAFQERIFHTFHQLEPEAGTSGLGLSLSKAIIEAHGGRIGFESGLGRTTFFFLMAGAAPPPQ